MQCDVGYRSSFDIKEVIPTIKRKHTFDDLVLSNMKEARLDLLTAHELNGLHYNQSKEGEENKEPNQYNQINKSDEKKHRKSNIKGSHNRTKKCGECPGCRMDDCGLCETCTINIQFRDKIKLGTAECLKRVCSDPILLVAAGMKPSDGKTLMQEMMAVQDDATNPFKIIDGELYDMRCYICKKLPRAGMATRSELYRHYSVYHFSAELMKEFSGMTCCPEPDCGKDKLKGKGLADHMGQVHNYVDKYIPMESRIPVKIQKSRFRALNNKDKNIRSQNSWNHMNNIIQKEVVDTSDEGTGVIDYQVNNVETVMVVPDLEYFFDLSNEMNDDQPEQVGENHIIESARLSNLLLPIMQQKF